MTYREKLLSIGTVDLCDLVDLDRAEQVAIEADAEIAGLRADAERIDAQWRDELRIYRETENARIAGLEAEVSRLRADAERYRWLREHFRFANDSMYELWFDGTLAADGQLELDAAIDAARANGGAG